MTAKQQQGAFIAKVPDGDNRTRLVCPDCGYVEYTNPKIVVGAVCTWEDRVLLCRRAIAPSLGLWTIPAGFMETGETTAEGAAREVWEEARARVTIDGLVGLYEIPHIAQVNVIYRAPMRSADHAPGEESEAVGLFLLGGHPVGRAGLSVDPLGAGTVPRRRYPGGARLRPPRIAGAGAVDGALTGRRVSFAGMTDLFKLVGPLRPAGIRIRSDRPRDTRAAVAGAPGRPASATTPPPCRPPSTASTSS